MNRSSPGVRRVAAILDFMADHPGEAFSLTDLVRALKLSRATCHALLTGLVDVGYLYRTSEKTYVLGPALAAIGRAALAHCSPLEIAKPEMRSLADEYDVVCSAVVRDGDMAVVRERAASVSHVGFSIPLGTRLKLRTPFAAAFLSWSPQEAKDWLSSPVHTPTPTLREAMERGIAFARTHGFLAMLRNPAADWERSPEQLFGGDTKEFPIMLANALDRQTGYDLSSITAPVLNGRGRVEFVMGLLGFNRKMSGAEIIRAAEKLKGACGRISAFAGGQMNGEGPAA